MSRIEALCISEKKQDRKHPVDVAVFLRERGIEGDAHAGPWHRQVSILLSEDIETVRAAGLPDVRPGDFAENVILSSLDFASSGLGTRLRLGHDAEISISQTGKTCHTRCRIYHLTGDCIMPRKGLFARVTTGGVVRVGDAVEVLHAVPRACFQVVVLTASDRCSKGEAVDTAGPAVCHLIEETLGAHIYRRKVLPDDQAVLTRHLLHYCDGHSLDLVITVGGTGFSPRDTAPEATRSVIERFTPGLDEAMRSTSIKKNPHAILSRGVSGIRGSTLIINLPGSKSAAVENLESILGALRHGLMKLRGDMTPCGGDSNVEGSNVI